MLFIDQIRYILKNTTNYESTQVMHLYSPKSGTCDNYVIIGKKKLYFSSFTIERTLLNPNTTQLNIQCVAFTGSNGYEVENQLNLNAFSCIVFPEQPGAVICWRLCYHYSGYGGAGDQIDVRKQLTLLAMCCFGLRCFTSGPLRREEGGTSSYIHLLL